MKKRGGWAGIALICCVISVALGIWFGKESPHRCCQYFARPDLMPPDSSQQPQVVPQNQLQVAPVPLAVPPSGGPGNPPGNG